jgi:hypothetical protein
VFFYYRVRAAPTKSTINEIFAWMKGGEGDIVINIYSNHDVSKSDLEVPPQSNPMMSESENKEVGRLTDRN